MPLVRKKRRSRWHAMERFVTVWAGVLAVAAALMAMVVWREMPPRAAPISAPEPGFSAARAWPLLSYLADTLLYRVTGTPTADSAAHRLLAMLQDIPGVEATIQDVTGTVARGGGTRVVRYRTRNVLARIVGRDKESGSVLVSGHYDSPVESVGASDDAAATAVMVEMARAIAAGPQLEHGVVFNINGAEEQGLLGAHGFLQHPWIKDVRAFVNLESAGPAGKAVLFQSGPGDAWLARAYARAAPYPYGTVMAQDIFQSGVIPSSTDFEVYTGGGGLHGLDIAFYRDGWKYHTQLDRTWYVQQGSLQHMGANALATVRALANGPLPGAREASPSAGVYFDVLGVTMISYDARWAPVLAIVLALLSGIAIALAYRAFSLQPFEVVVGTLTQLGAAALAVAIPVGLAWVVANPLDHPMGWFSRPRRAYFAYAPLAVAVMLVLHAAFHRWRARPPVDRSEFRSVSVWIGGHGLLLLALLVMTVKELGSGYLLLWWLFPSAVGLIVMASTRGKRWVLASLVAFVPGATATLQVSNMLLAMFVPVAGRMPASGPFDPIIAAMIAGCTVLVMLLPISLAHRAKDLLIGSAIAGGVGLVALVTCSLTFPYALSRPQRLALVHDQIGDSASIRITSPGFDSPQRAMEGVTGARTLPATGYFPAADGVDAGPTGFSAPELVVLGQTRAPGNGSDVRSVDIRVAPSDAYAVIVRMPAARMAGWSLSDSVGTRARRDTVYVARFVSAPDTGWRFTLRIHGREPVPVEATAVRAVTTPAAHGVIVKLAPWADVHAVATNRRRYGI